jgi:hypothetical protein
MIEAQQPGAAWATMSWRSLMIVFLIGTAVGLLTYALYIPLTKFVFEPILCGNDSVALVRCGTETSFASAIAIVLGSMVGLIFLVRERIFRPLLVILAAALSLWGLLIIITSLPFLVGLLVTAVVFGIGYATFAWFAQSSNLITSLITITLVIIATRLVLNA